MSRTVLIIESNEEILENIAEILELKNYNIITATNGSAGLTLALQMQPDLILCDIVMPKLNGYEVIRSLKKSHGTEHIPVIFITAQCEKECMQQAQILGAARYIVKPFDCNVLIHEIELLLTEHRCDDQNLLQTRSLS